jgi:pyrroline-5-carboxylate reductase
MALAIARSVDANALTPRAGRIYYDPFTAHKDAFAGFGFRPAGTPEELLASAEVIVLAVKPQMLPEVIPYLANRCQGKCIVSILAGVSAGKLREAVGGAAAVFRVMPNTPMMIGSGAAVIAEPPPEEREWLPGVMSLFASSGIAEVMPEPLIDAATGLNGSSPAYFFRIAEAMANWGESQGIPYRQALRLSAQAMAGAAGMMMASGEDPLELLSRVTSKGGSTLAALSAFDERQLEAMFEEALNRCRDRSRELGR